MDIVVTQEFIMIPSACNVLVLVFEEVDAIAEDNAARLEHLALVLLALLALASSVKRSRNIT